MHKNFLKVNEASEYLGMTTAYLYKLVQFRKIPYYKPNGKFLYFSVEELDAWISANRVATISELDEKAGLHMGRRA